MLCHRLTEEYGEVLVKDPLDATIALPSTAVLVKDASPDQPVLVEAEALHTHFRDRVSLLGQLTGQRPGYLRAVNGIDLNIRRGETVGLVGKSGSGKTTLGKTLLRLIQSSGGRILFEGQDITTLNDNEVRPMRARMQMIFQDPISSLSPRMKVVDLLMEPFRDSGRACQPKRESAAAACNGRHGRRTG